MVTKMSNKRGLVTVIHSYGDEDVSDAIVRGIVSAEMRRMQDDLDFARWCLNKRRSEKISSRFVYDVRPSRGVVRFYEQLVGLLILIADERRTSNAYKR